MRVFVHFNPLWFVQLKSKVPKKAQIKQYVKKKVETALRFTNFESLK